MQALDTANHLMSKLAPWREDRYDIAEDATISFMNKIKNGVKKTCGRRGKDCNLVEFTPEHPTTMIRYEIVGLLYNEKTKFSDNITSLDEYLEKGLKTGEEYEY